MAAVSAALREQETTVLDGGQIIVVSGLLIGLVLDSAMAISPVLALMVGTRVQPRPAPGTVPRCTSAAATVKTPGS